MNADKTTYFLLALRGFAVAFRLRAHRPRCALGDLSGSTSSRLSSRPSRLRGCILGCGQIARAGPSVVSVVQLFRVCIRALGGGCIGLRAHRPRRALGASVVQLLRVCLRALRGGCIGLRARRPRWVRSIFVASPEFAGTGEFVQRSERSPSRGFPQFGKNLHAPWVSGVCSLPYQARDCRRGSGDSI
jgi:hypothetical protein